MQQKESSLVFVRSERLGRKYVLCSQCLELVVFTFVYCAFHSVSFGEAPLSPALASRKAWILVSLEKWVLAVIHRKTGRVCRGPAALLESSLPSCTAVRRPVLPGADTKQKSEVIYSSSLERPSMKSEDCLTHRVVHHISILPSWNERTFKFVGGGGVS